MNRMYHCAICNAEHDITSGIGIKHLKHTLSKQDIANFVNVATTIPTYEIVTNGIPPLYEGTDAFVREIRISEILQEKFPNMEAYHSSSGIKEWLEERMQGSNHDIANALSRIQGDAAGEVDFVRDMQGHIGNLFTKTDFVRNAEGRVTSNNPGIDAVEVNRFTGDIVQEYQVKTLRSADSINDTLKDFLNNDHYNANITLVGPQELIDRAHELGIPNPTITMGTLQDNLASAQYLSGEILSGQMAVDFTPLNVGGQMIGGGMIGAAVSVTVSGLIDFIAYKQGRIAKGELKRRLGKAGVKGAITGSALAGLSLFIPGGIIGFGIAAVVGLSLRRLIDEAYGDGTTGEVLKMTNAVHANVELAHRGAVYIAQIAEVNDRVLADAISTVNDMQEDRFQAHVIYDHIEKQHTINPNTDYTESVDHIYSRLDRMRAQMMEREGR